MIFALIQGGSVSFLAVIRARKSPLREFTATVFWGGSACVSKRSLTAVCLDVFNLK